MASLTVPQHSQSPVDDAEVLRKAVQGWGTDEKTIISILGHRDAVHRRLIRAAYQELFQEDLIKRIESEISGDFERAVYRWIFDPAERDAILAQTAIKADAPNNRIIVEIACARSPSELLAAKQAYQLRYKHSLEEDVASHNTGEVRKLLVALVGTHRYEGNEVNLRLAKSEAEILREAIEGKHFGHDEILRIIGTRSKAQLNATFNCYKDEYGSTITKGFLVGDRHGDEYMLLMRAAIRCINVPEKYFEKVLRNAINKVGTDEDSLTRVIVTRAEKDLAVIKEEYYKRNSVSLSHAVAKDTHGDYKDFLLTLLGESDL